MLVYMYIEKESELQSRVEKQAFQAERTRKEQFTYTRRISIELQSRVEKQAFQVEGRWTRKSKIWRL